MGRKEIGALIASGAVALFVGLIVSALQIAGVISMGVAHMLIFVAWLVAVVAVCTSERVLSRTPKHTIVVGLLTAVIVGVALLGLDRWMVHKKAAQEAESAAHTPASQMQAGMRSFLTPDSKPMPDSPCGPVPASMKAAFVGGNITYFGLGVKSFSLISIGREDVLSVEENAPNSIVINATIRDENDQLVATITKNVFHTYAPNSYDVRGDEHSILILNSMDDTVLYVHYLNPQAIEVRGLFRKSLHRRVRVEAGRYFVGSQEFDGPQCSSNTGIQGKDWWALEAALVVN